MKQFNNVSLDLGQVQRNGPEFPLRTNHTVNQTPHNVQESSFKSSSLRQGANVRDSQHIVKRAKHVNQNFSINGNNIIFQYQGQDKQGNPGSDPQAASLTTRPQNQLPQNY